MPACNHVPLEHQEKFCPVCGRPMQYCSPVISQRLSEPIMEYVAYAFHDNSVDKGNALTTVNDWAKDGWRVIAAIGTWLILERPRRSE